MLRARTWLAVLAALPVSLFAVRAISVNLSDFFNPCVGWGVGSSGAFQRSANAPCVQVTLRSETKTQAAVQMAAVPSVVLLAAVLGVWGAARSRPKVAFAGACLMFLEAIPLVFSIWPLALIAGGGFLWVACRSLTVAAR